jgi:type I restriction enzyme M protein
VQQDHKLVRFFLPKKARWTTIAQKTTGLGEHLTDAVRSVARENPLLQGVIDVTDYNATTAGQRIVDDARLASLVQVLNNPNYRLGLHDVEPDILGRAYEYLLRKFAEGQGQSAGEFYTPREVAVVMARILDPKPGATVYDPCCGSGGLLIKCHLRLLEKKGKRQDGRLQLPSNVAPLKLFGQEINGSTFAIARMNSFLHDMEAEIMLGDTMHRPAFTVGDGSLRQFDLVIANPMWNQKFPASNYENDPYERFRCGTPPSSSADWGWVQHMVAGFVGIFENLEKALAFDSQDVKGVVEGIDVLKERFAELMDRGRREYLPITLGKKGDKAVEALLDHFLDKEQRQEFYQFFRELEEVYEILSPDPFLRPFKEGQAIPEELSEWVKRAYEQALSSEE